LPAHTASLRDESGMNEVHSMERNKNLAGSGVASSIGQSTTVGGLSQNNKQTYKQQKEKIL